MKKVIAIITLLFNIAQAQVFLTPGMSVSSCTGQLFRLRRRNPVSVRINLPQRAPTR